MTKKQDIRDNENYEEKFIVINIKRIAELAANTAQCKCRESGCGCFNLNPASKEGDNLLKALGEFNEAYEERVGRKNDSRYLIVNQDEPYAIDVWKKIEQHHERK